MKYLSIVLVVLLVSCAGVQYNAPELPADLCMEYPVEKSLIRKVAADNNIDLADLYYGMIDAVAIGMVTDALDRKKVAEYLEEVILFMESRRNISYAYLIAHMTDANQWGDKWPLIESILFRRITVFNSSLIISEHDRCLILSGLRGAIEDLYLS